MKALFNPFVCIIALLFAASGIAAQSFNHKTTEYTTAVVHANSIVSPGGSFGAVNTYTALDNTLWSQLDPNVSGNSIGHLKVKEVRSFVKFYIDHNNTQIYAPYTYKIHYKIRGFTVPGNDNVYTELLDDLTIGYNPDSVNAYQDIHMKSYYGYYKISVQVLDIYDYTCLYSTVPGAPPPCSTAPTSGFIALNTLSSMAQNWNLEIGLTDQKIDKDLKNGSSWVSASGTGIQLSVSNTPPAVGDNYLKIQWQLVSGQQPLPALYEIEWTYVDNYKVSFASNSLYSSYPVYGSLSAANLSYNFKENATRVTTDKNEYSLPVIWKKGYLIYRVRLIRPDDIQYKNSVYGQWSIVNDIGTISSLSTNSYLYIDDNNVHLQDKYNWNFQSSFAEEGKSKQVVTYYDGLLKNRQTVTKFNALRDQQIVAEQYYNYEGKVGLQTLPLPIAQTALRFVNGFSSPSASVNPYTAADFDNLTFSPLPAMNSQSPAANYYSSNNSFYSSALPAWKYLKGLPDAQGYPLLQTKYTPEGDRVSVQGGVGSELQIGQGHETKSYYMPPDQIELNKYFGLNTGKSTFYEKTITADPNKQLSYAIKDNRGKLVMTGLMGYPAMPGGTPPSTNPADFPKTNLLTGTAPGWSGTVRSYNRAFFQEVSGNANFDFDLSMPSFSPCNGSYLSVPLTYSLRVFNEFNVPTGLASGTAGALYGGVSNVPVSVNANSLSANVNIGKAIVDYKLSYKSDDVASAVDQLLHPAMPNPIPINWTDPYPTCLKGENDFLKDALDAIDLNCDQPNAEDEPQCKVIENILKSELFPTAKYGRYTNANGMLTGMNSSIFSIGNLTGGATTLALGNFHSHSPYDVYFNNLSGTEAPLYRYQYFLNTLANPNTPIGNTGYTIAQLRDMNVNDFIRIFNGDIAQLLLPLHPEYCTWKKMFCDNTDFQQRLSRINSYAEAVSYGFGNLNAIAVADPFNTALGSSGSNAAAKLKNIKVYYPDNGTSQDERIDVFAYTKLFCGGDPACKPFAAALSEATINAIVSGLPADLQDKYFSELVNLYQSNRQMRIAHYPNDDNSGFNCNSSSYAVCIVVGYGAPAIPPAFTTASNSGNYASANGISSGANTSIGNSLTSPASTTLTASQANANGQNTGSYTKYANAIAAKLSNCTASNNILSQSQLASIVSSKLNLSDEANGWKGGLTPDKLKVALTDAGVALDDLCNPYLADYLQTVKVSSTECRDPDFYSSVGEFFTLQDVITGMVTAYNLTTQTSLSSYTTNDYSATWSTTSPITFEREMAIQLKPFSSYVSVGTSANVNIKYKIKYNESDRSFTYYFHGSNVAFDYINGVTIYVKKTGSSSFVSHYNASYSGTYFSSNDPVITYTRTPGQEDKLNINISCDPTRLRSESLFPIIFTYLNEVAFETWTGNISGLRYPDPPEMSSCISCLELKKSYETFVSDVISTYGIKGKGHPFFEDAVRSYFNFAFKENHTSKEYLDFFKGCDLTDQYRIPSYYAYMYASSGYGNTPADTNALNLVCDYIRTQFSSGDYSNFNHFYYFTTNNTAVDKARLFVDFTSLPKGKIRALEQGLSLYISSHSGFGTPVPYAPTIMYNYLESETGVNNVLADLFVHYIPGAATFYPGVTQQLGGGNTAPPTMNWYPDLCKLNQCNYMGNTITTNVALTEELVTVRDNNILLPFKRFHFDFASNNTSPSAPTAALLRYKYETALPDPSRGFQSFSSYMTTKSTLNLQPAKKDYLTYVYGQDQLFVNNGKDALISSLMPAQLQGNINTSNGYQTDYTYFPYVSYYNADKAGLSGDLFLDQNGGSTGLSDVSNVLAFVKNNTSAPSTTFPILPVSVPQYGNESLMIRYIGNNIFWYHLKDVNTKLQRNIWLKIPDGVSASDLPNYIVNNVAIAPVAANTRRFIGEVHKTNGPVLKISGKTDFNLTDNPITVYNNVMLCPDNAAAYDTISTCYEQQLAAAGTNSHILYQSYIDSVRQDYISRFDYFIKNNIAEHLKMQIPQAKYANTLYGYDRADNLMYTVPPEGVHTISDAYLDEVDNFRDAPSSYHPSMPPFYTPGANAWKVPLMTPAHDKVTYYYHNSLGQLTSQNSPDAGVTNYYYDKAGRLLFSQNAKQLQQSKYSYTLYDGQSRAIETGQLASSPNIASYVSSLKSYTFSYSSDVMAAGIIASTREDVIHTFYDEELLNLSTATGMSRQQNLRSRVATVGRYKTLAGIPAGTAYSIALHYSYDLSGNVKTMTYDMPALADIKQQYKRIDYDFDLYSGKVTLVSYNRSFADQFYQRYTYDDDNKITKTETSQDGVLWDKDASYKYYPHGALARISLGDLQVQGIDYAYTLQGWLKSINGDTPDPNKDMGGDGTANSAYQPDLLRSSLYYYKNDYKPIDATDYNSTAGSTMLKIPDLDQPGAPAPQSLYNGNIAAALNIPGAFPALYTNYKYDQLNRLTEATYKLPDYTAATAASILRSFSDPSLSGQAIQNTGQTGATTANDLFKSTYAYDLDGNITSMKRFGLKSGVNGIYNYTSGSVFLMDDLQYFYEPNVNKNRLFNFTDNANQSTAATGFSNDLKYYNPSNANTTHRLMYDAIGNLTQDLSNNLSAIAWNAYGKTTSVTMPGSTSLSFGYDPANNRFSKTFSKPASNQNEYYIRDASGNELAVYRHLQSYHMENPYTALLGPIIGKTTFGTDLTGALGNDASFALGLIRATQELEPAYAQSVTAGKTPGYYMQRNQNLRSAMMRQTPGLAAGLLAQNEALVIDPLVANGYNRDLFRLVLAEPDDSVQQHFATLLISDTDTLLANGILEAMEMPPATDRTDFGIKFNAAMRRMEPAGVHNILEAALGSEQLRAAAVRLVNDAAYMTRGQIDDPSLDEQLTVDRYVVNLLAEAGDKQAIAAYYDQSVGNAATLLNGIADQDTRLLTVYNDNPAAFVDGVKATGNGPAILNAGLTNTDAITPTSLLSKLISLNPNDLDYANVQLIQVLDHNVCYLSEHDMYGSQRLGLKTYWPTQYRYEWDGTKTAAQNQALMAQSEFTYRRAWYSKAYNSLIDGGSTEPWGNASTMVLYSARVLGQKRYELTNHLGNVMGVITDKLTEAKAVPTAGIPSLAVKRASLFAAYDYYPFGMLMPERFIEDHTQQCVPVSHTRYVTKYIDISAYTFDNPLSLALLKAATPGVTITSSEATGIKGALIRSTVEEELPAAYYELTGTTITAGKELSVILSDVTNDNTKGTGNGTVHVAIEQYDSNDPNAVPIELASYEVRNKEDVTLNGKALNGNAVRVLVRGANYQKGIVVSAVTYKAVDQVQEAYTVQECNTDDIFGTDYRFGFNGQQKDNEIAGVGNMNTAMFWEYDTRLGRRWNLDPVFKASLSSYSCFANSPISIKDPNGDDSVFYNQQGKEIGRGKTERDLAFAEDATGTVSHDGLKFRQGLSYASLFGDENNPAPQRYNRIIYMPNFLTTLGEATSNSSNADLEGPLVFWFKSGPRRAYDYKNSGELAAVQEHDAIDVGGVLINRHEAGMIRWGYVASKAYRFTGNGTGFAYALLAHHNKAMHLSLEGDPDEYGEIKAWTLGFALNRGSDKPWLTIRNFVDVAMKYYYLDEPKKLVDTYDASKNDPHSSTWIGKQWDNIVRGMIINFRW